MQQFESGKENFSTFNNAHDRLKMNKLFMVSASQQGIEPPPWEWSNRSATNKIPPKPPSINSNLAISNAPKLIGDHKACISTPFNSNNAHSNQGNVYLKNTKEDPMKLLLMAAESESQEVSSSIDMKGYDWSKRILPSIKVQESPHFILLSRPLPLPRGLPNPLQIQLPFQPNLIENIKLNPIPIKIDPLGELNESARKGVPIFDILFEAKPAKIDCEIKISPKAQSVKGQTPKFECGHPGCIKYFPSRSRLRRHLLIHTGQKPFKCLFEGCDRRFSRRDNMMQHSRTHIMNEPMGINIIAMSEDKINRNRLKRSDKGVLNNKF
jgi:hypothetical protein